MFGMKKTTTYLLGGVVGGLVIANFVVPGTVKLLLEKIGLSKPTA